MTKTCSGCKTEKDIGCFNKNRSSKDGLSSRCKNCNRAYCSSWKQVNYEKLKAHRSIYYQMHKAETRAYKKVNREKIQAYQKKYKARNREYLNAIERLRKQKIRAKEARYTAKINSQQIKPENSNNNFQPRLFNA